MKEMRRKDRQISDEETLAILEKGIYGVLSTVTPENEPCGVPVNYCLVDNSIYFHCAMEGQKLENIAHNPKISFCVVGDIEVEPATFSIKYESCIIHGTASQPSEEEKQAALEGLVKKYSAEYWEKGLEYIANAKDKTNTIKITIESMTGKAKR